MIAVPTFHIVYLLILCDFGVCFSSNAKLLSMTELYSIVHEEVNGLLSENQLNYICKILSNTGKVSTLSPALQ